MKKVWITLCVGACLATIYLAMLANSNSVVRDVKEVMLGHVAESQTNGTTLDVYNFSNDLLNAKVKVKITRLFVFHDFFDGYMWVRYSYETLKNDYNVTPCADSIISCWKIHREHGRWEIVEITEAP